MAWAQSTTTTYTTDINGHRVEAISVGSTDGSRTERSQSINGQKVPLEQADERILREDSNGKTVERVIRKYDQTGRLSSTERVVIEEQKRPDGSHVEETTFRSDINGNMQRAEQRVSDTRASGNTRTTETVIARPTLNGAFETTEKRARVVEGSGDRQQTSETVQRRGDGGQFHDAIREVKVTEKVGADTKESIARYEPGMNGQLELASQDVSTTSKRADGTEVTQVNLYARSAYGIAQERGAPQQIKEQQIIERRKMADGSVVETLSARRPSVSDATKLGALEKISETVCAGKCEAAKP
jgi:hypothetical protein